MEEDLLSRPDGGWEASSANWAALIDRGDLNREILLDPVMLRLIGDVAGKLVLDLGCGEGRFSRMLQERHAVTVGLDIASSMVHEAQHRNPDGRLYVQGSGSALPFGDHSLDLVVSYLSIIDIPDFANAIRESARVLKPGGRLLAASMSFAGASEGWELDPDGKRLYVKLNNYVDERVMTLDWSGIRVLNWHRPLGAYMRAYLAAGLQLLDYVEPVPADQSLRDNPKTEDWFRIPIFDVMLWQKPA